MKKHSDGSSQAQCPQGRGIQLDRVATRSPLYIQPGPHKSGLVIEGVHAMCDIGIAMPALRYRILPGVHIHVIVMAVDLVECHIKNVIF